MKVVLTRDEVGEAIRQYVRACVSDDTADTHGLVILNLWAIAADVEVEFTRPSAPTE